MKKTYDMPNLTVLRMEAQDVLTGDLSSVGLETEEETAIWPVE